MIVYIYDGSFDGLLTCIFEAYYRHENPDDIIPMDRLQNNFLYQRYIIKTDSNKARKVYRSIAEKISTEALKRVFYAYLSELDGSGGAILNYLRIGFKIGRDIDSHLSNDAVLTMDKLNHKVSGERHAMLGLLRFKMLESNILYANYEPQYNVTGLIAPHFVNRIPNENWIIHDIKRNIAALYNKKEWIIKELELEDEMIIHEDEEDYQEMWKSYYRHISIASRKNLRLKKNNMSMKYWKHLVELK